MYKRIKYIYYKIVLRRHFDLFVPSECSLSVAFSSDVNTAVSQRKQVPLDYKTSSDKQSVYVVFTMTAQIALLHN